MPQSITIRNSSNKANVHIGCGDDLISSSTVNNDQWNYVAVTQDSNYLYSLYVNGVLEDGPKDIRGGNSVTGGNEVIGFVWSGGTETAYFNGLIDNVRIYNQVLSAEQIALDYNSGAPDYKSISKYQTGSGEERMIRLLHACSPIGIVQSAQACPASWPPLPVCMESALM